MGKFKATCCAYHTLTSAEEQRYKSHKEKKFRGNRLTPPERLYTTAMRVIRKNWFRAAGRKLFRSSSSSSSPQHDERIIVLLHNNTTTTTTTSIGTRRSADEFPHFLTKEELAAIKIQARFRAHLARRAFRALRSLVKLQALVRGVCVRRQARIALQCMHALARLQVTIRARQLLMY